MGEPTEDERRAAATWAPAEVDRKIVQSWGWVGVSYAGGQTLAFVSTLVLVRLLEPEAFGLVALSAVVVNLVMITQGSGLWAAVVHRRGDIRQAAASALIFTPLASVAFYCLTYASAPLVARVLKAPDLTDVLRVIALVMVIQALGRVPSAIVEREMNFRARAKSELSGALVQFAASVALAFAGLGVWSLVFGSLAGALASTLAYWLVVPWRPRLSDASWKVLRELMVYGRPVLGARVLSLMSGALDKVLLGRLVDTTAVGFYSVTFRLATLPESVIGYVVGRPMFAAYSSLQHDIDAVRRAYAQQLGRTALLTLPLAISFAAAAEPIVLVFFGEEWREVIPTLRILALYSLFWAMLTPSADLWRGIGRPRLEFLFGLMRLPVLAGALLLLIPRYGLNGAALAVLVASVGTGLPSLAVTLRIIGLSPSELGRALAPAALSAAPLGAFFILVLPLTTSVSPLAALAIMTSVGFLVYVGGAAVFARSVVRPIWLSLRESRTRRQVTD